MTKSNTETETETLTALREMYAEALSWGPRASSDWAADTVAKRTGLSVRVQRNALRRLQTKGLVRSIVRKTQSPRQVRRNAWSNVAYYSLTRAAHLGR